MKSVLAYVRVSTTRQGEKGVSLQEQRSAIEVYCQKHDLHIADWYEEQETAAAQGRRVFLAIIKRLRASNDYGLVVHKIDRSARNLKDWAMIQDLIDAAVPVHFAHESLDLNTRGGRLAADIQAVVAADYIRNLRDEVHKGFNGRLKQGLYPLRAPIGYLDNGGGKVKTLDPATAPYVRLCFELYDSGTFTLDTLRVELQRRGLRNAAGAFMSLNGLNVMLRNCFYIGLIHIKTTGQMFPGIHEPLVRKALFDRVQARLSGRAKHHGLKHAYFYRRLLVCQLCHSKLIGEQQKGHIYYRCHTRGCPIKCVRQEWIDEQLRIRLDGLHLNSELLSMMRQVAESFLAERIKSKANFMQAATLRIHQIDDRLTRLTDAYVDQIVDRAIYTDRREQLLHARASAQEELRNIEAGEQANRERAETFLEQLEDLHSNVEWADDDDKPNLLQSVTSNLTVSPETVVVSWRKGFRMIAKQAESGLCGPNRDTCRTAIQEALESDEERTASKQ